MKFNVFVTLLFFIILFSIEVQAQLKIGIDGFLSPKVNFPLKTGKGGQIYGRYLLMDKHLGIGISVGYMYFYKNYNGLYHERLSVSNLTTSFEYYFLTKKLKPYAGFEAGTFLTSNDENQVKSVYFYSQEPILVKKVSAGIAPVIGLNIGLSSHFDINAAAIRRGFLLLENR